MNFNSRLFKEIVQYLIKFFGSVFLVLIFCEYLIYYVVIYQCNYKQHENSSELGLKAMILADTHMLGPFRGHPFDRLRREWQMERSFQTSIQLFDPDIVIILGDVFDEGNWVDHKGFLEYVERFKTIFHVPDKIRMYAVHGNHDVSFHYRMHPYLVSRFNQAFNTTGVKLIREKKILKDGTKKMFNFVVINSMALEGDGCALCTEAELEIKAIKRKMDKLKGKKKYSAPIILQHFPTFRESDEKCLETNSVHNDKYREKWETLSADATNFIAENLKPRLFLSGHSHHFCRINNSVGVEEFTIASFNWRNLNNPSFLLAVFTAEKHSMSLCELPKESTVIGCYVIGVLVILIYFINDVVRRIKFRRKINIE